MRREPGRTMTIARLALIGLVAGVFSTVFGVGGGIVLVPLLIGLVGLDTHSAAATSLGAILVTASAGALLYAVRGEVRLGYALLVGLPAVGGAILGTHLQQRLSGRALTLAFSVLLAVIGVRLIAL
ncbi:MAG TPA: sulfite exporter TauE/SafE family protein [Gaiella sp.]